MLVEYLECDNNFLGLWSLEPFLTSQEIVSQFPDFDLPFGKGFFKRNGTLYFSEFYKEGKLTGP